MSEHTDYYKKLEPILVAAEDWKETSLLHGDSIFGAGAIWNAKNVTQLEKNFVENLIEGPESFFDKFERQIEHTGSDVKKLAAEMFWVMMLCPSNDNIGVSKKVSNIERIWSWSNDSLESDHKYLADTVLSGVGGVGRGYTGNYWRELIYFIQVLKAFFSLENARKGGLLTDGWEFAKWLQEIRESDKRQLRHMLLFMLFPNEFGRIFSAGDRSDVLQNFRHLKPADIKKMSAFEIDQEISKIRKGLEHEYGVARVDWYSSPFQEMWKGDGVKTVKETSISSVQENTAEYARKEGEARNIIYYGPPGTGKTYKLNQLRDEYEAKQTEKSELDHLVSIVEPLTLWEVIALTLADLGGKAKVGEIFDHQLLKTRSELQSNKSIRRTSIWGSLQNHTVLDSETVKTSIQYRHAPYIFDKDEESLWRLVDGWQDEAQNVEDALKQLKGEYEVAGKNLKRYEYVTFHQSYSYEDFVEGIRPVQDEDTQEMVYQIEPGVFKRICSRAKADPENRYAIFIDEINRGNITKILGELITLIEPDKRAKYDADGNLLKGMELTLPNSKDFFSVPENLDIYGTMNTADRSIALLDKALRRRFDFEELMPNPEVIKGFEDNGLINDGKGGFIDLRKLLGAINKRMEFLLDRDQTIGHAYFINVQSFADLKKVMLHKILPLLQEYFYEDWHRIQLVLRDVGPDKSPNLPQIICHNKIEEQDVLGFDHDDYEDGISYQVADLNDISPDAIRKIYE